MIGNLLALFNPLKWYEKIVSVVTTLAVLSGLVWWGWSALGNHFTEKQDAEYARVEAVATANKLQREALNDANTKKAKDEKIKQLEAAAASARRAADSAAGLRDDLRASENRAKTDLITCLQHARAVGGLFTAIDDFAGRVAKEADGHVADKIACANSWPK